MSWRKLPPIYIDPQGRFIKNQASKITIINPNVRAITIHGFNPNSKDNLKEDELDNEKC